MMDLYNNLLPIVVRRLDLVNGNKVVSNVPSDEMSILASLRILHSRTITFFFATIKCHKYVSDPNEYNQ
jgi:hypothetical protein